MMIKKMKIIKMKIIRMMIKNKMMKLKVKLQNVMINLERKILKTDYKYSYYFPFIISKLGENITNESESIIRYSFSMFTLSFIVLICFINVFGYIVSLYLISKYDIETRFPKFKGIIKYFEKTTLFIIVLEALIGFIFLIFIVVINFIFCGMMISI